MILGILKGIGIALLIILGILLLLIAVVLFVPIRYRFDITYLERADGSVEVRWAPVLLKAVVRLVDNRPEYVVRLFGGIVMTNTEQKLSWIGRKFFAGSGEDTDEEWMEDEDSESLEGKASDRDNFQAAEDEASGVGDSEEKKDEASGLGDLGAVEDGASSHEASGMTEKKSDVADTVEENETAAVKPDLAETAENKSPEDNSGEAFEEGNDMTGSDDNTDEESGGGETVDSAVETAAMEAEDETGEEKSGIRSKIDKLTAKVKNLKKKKDSLQKVMGSKQFRKAKGDVLIYIRKLFKIICPYRFSGRLRFGASDPSVTGQAFGILAMLYPVYQKHVTVIPEFAESCLEAEVKGKGRIFLISIVILAIRIIFNKNLIKTGKKVKTIMEA